MTKDWNWEPDEIDLNENDILYTDMVIQLVSSWFSGDTKVIQSVCESISDDIKDSDSGMTGILFGCILHITNLLNRIAEDNGKDLEENWVSYLNDYNNHYRKRMSSIPILHPQIADQLAKKLFNEEK